MVPKDFWKEFRGEFGNYVQFVWVRDQKFGREGVHLEKGDGGAFFTKGWVRFTRRHRLKKFDLLILTYVGSSTFNVEKPCLGWISAEEEEEDQGPPISLVDLTVDDEKETPRRRGSGRKRPAVEIMEGYDFGCAYPDFKSTRTELGFSFTEAAALSGQTGSREVELYEYDSDTMWPVTLHTYPSRERYVFCKGWSKVRDDLNLLPGDIVSFKVLDIDSEIPTIFIHVAKP